ncbi:uncharacterized protein KD926_002561 [Aspergillus affinis]|uniref:uncharacterized protein n=1 Tax=Aspergillus affinis TaxID=1070780 RepID=UPI0022FDDC19|nr:uncharacterized protein KD926_002561 [Aspergillus affinis]KAI9035996.1 hypothetical protein KD926_002561 [Aspergillus affinis]
MRDLYEEMQEEWRKEARTISSDLGDHKALESDDKLDTASALDEALAAGERDDLEATVLILLPSESGKVRVEMTRVSSCADDTGNSQVMLGIFFENIFIGLANTLASAPFFAAAGWSSSRPCPTVNPVRKDSFRSFRILMTGKPIFDPQSITRGRIMELLDLSQGLKGIPEGKQAPNIAK